MNIVSVWGDDDAKCELIERVAYFCIDQLMPRMKTLDICIDTEIGDENADGFCLANSKRQFEILIDGDLEGDDLVTAVCHELVHVSQISQGRLSINERETYETVEQYLNLWFEIEAYQLQEILLTKYKESCHTNVID